MTENLRKRVVMAIGATSISRGLAKAVSLVSTLVLVRLISPDDFGLMALAMTVTGFIGFFNEIGIGAALVQRPTVSDREINGCFGIGALLSIVLCIVVFALSWPAAQFFRIDAMQPVVAVLGLGFFFGAANTVPNVLLQRDLRFQVIVWSEVTGAIVQSLIALPLAYFGMRYWALVGSFFAGQIVSTVWLWRATQWRPSWPFHIRDGLTLLSYGLNVTYTRLLWYVYMNADKVIIGKILNTHAVGIYDVSRSLAQIPTSQIAGLVNGIAGPVFSRLQSDPSKLKAVFIRLNRGVTYLVLPALMGIIIVAPDLVTVMLGIEWNSAILPLQALCVSEIIACLNSLQAQLLISTGYVKRLVKFTGICAIVMPLAITVGAISGGLVGVAVAWAVCYPLLNIWLLRETLGIVGVSYLEFWRAIKQPLFGTVAMIGAIIALQFALGPLLLPDGVSLWATIGAGFLVYAAYLVMLDQDGIAEIRQILIDFGVPAAKLQRWPFER